MVLCALALAMTGCSKKEEPAAEEEAAEVEAATAAEALPLIRNFIEGQK